MLRCTLLAVLLTLGFTARSQGDDQIPPEILQKVKRASVFIKVSTGPLDSSGSGFVVHTADNTVFVVTNSHVISRPNLQAEKNLPPAFRLREALEMRRLQLALRNQTPQVTTVFNSGTEEELVRPAEVVANDATRDLAILKITDVPTPPEPIPLQTEKKPFETMSIFTFGFPFGEALANAKSNPAITVGKGSVSSLRRDERGEDLTVQIDGALNPGNSGGPVVDTQGRLVGVAVATIRGAGIGFAIAPATVIRLLEGGVSHMQVTQQKEPDGLALKLELTLFDPLHKIQQLSANCLTGQAPVAEGPPAALAGSEPVNLVIENGKATGLWKLAPGSSPPGLVSVQPVRTDAAGTTALLPVLQVQFSVPRPVTISKRPAPQEAGFGSAIDREPGADETDRPFYVHRGLSRKIGQQTLTEGILVMPDNTRAVGFGVRQTGPERMQFTYLQLVRLAPGDYARKRSSTRNSSINQQIQMTVGIFLDDQPLTVSHQFQTGKGGLRNEQYVIQDQPFDPQAGRLFLVDLAANPQVVEQQNIALPPLESVLELEDGPIAGLAQKTVAALKQDHEVVRKFLGTSESPP